MAGGTYIRREKVQAQKNVLISCLNGQVFNMISTNDEALVIYETIYARKSIGRNPHFNKDRHNACCTNSAQ